MSNTADVLLQRTQRGIYAKYVKNGRENNDDITRDVASLLGQFMISEQKHFKLRHNGKRYILKIEEIPE